MPTSALRVDADVALRSPKGYSERDLQEIAATVPAIYERVGAGWSPGDFEAAQWSEDQRERVLGETYVRLFRDMPTSEALSASYDGHDLVVDSGNHRVRAAQRIGVPVLPVWVSAPTAAELDHVETVCARRIEREGATACLRAHEKHEAATHSARAALRERAGGAEGRERDSHGWETRR